MGNYNMDEMQLLKQAKQEDIMFLDEVAGEVIMKKKTKYKLDTSGINLMILDAE